MGKSGIPYFPLDVELDERMELIEAEYGLSRVRPSLLSFYSAFTEGTGTTYIGHTRLRFCSPKDLEWVGASFRKS